MVILPIIHAIYLIHIVQLYLHILFFFLRSSDLNLCVHIDINHGLHYFAFVVILTFTSEVSL